MTLVTRKGMAKPAAWKNTYFWIAAILFVVGILGLPFLGGDHLIRDPGQEPESSLYLIYFGASVVMIINGLLSHSQTVQAYREHLENE